MNRYGDMAKLADAHDLGLCVLRRVSSTLTIPTPSLTYPNDQPISITALIERGLYECYNAA
jgi:hypothetical protein